MHKAEPRTEKIQTIVNEVVNCAAYRINPVFTALFLIRRYPKLFAPFFPLAPFVEKSRLLKLPRALGQVLPLLPPGLDAKTLYDHYVSFFFLEEYLPHKAWVVFDVGAYKGFYSFISAQLVGRQGRVFSFEPNPALGAEIRKKRKEMFLNNVCLVERGVGRREGLATICLARNSSSVSSFYRQHTHNRDSDFDEVEILVTTLDREIERRKIESLDLVKIDIEGAELEALQGSATSMERGIVKRFIIEVHEDVVSSARILKLFEKYGYRIDAFLRSTRQRKYIYASKK